MTDYMDSLKRRRKLKHLKDCCFFGEFAGIILLCYGFIGWLDAEKTIEGIFVLVAAIGGILLLLGLLLPEALTYPCKLFMALGNLIGKILFLIILSVIYLIVILPFHFNWKKRQGEYGFTFFESQSLEEDRRGFSEWSDQGTRNVKGILGLFGYFVDKKEYFLLPVLIILVSLGLLLFFVSSSVVAPFIYTLF